MAKVKKFAVGGVSSLGGMLAPSGMSPPPSLPPPPTMGSGTGTPVSSAGTSGGSAQDGLSQIDSGSGTVRNAINSVKSALGGGTEGGLEFKKGGSVKKYTEHGGRLNLKSSGVSTATKNKTKSNW